MLTIQQADQRLVSISEAAQAMLTIQQADQRLVSISEAAQAIGVHPRTIRRRIADGSLTGYRTGPRLIRVDMSELGAMLRPIPTAAGGDHDHAA